MNIVIITDTNGDTVDIATYCCDDHAQTDSRYDGWYGCVENDSQFVCRHCGELA
jgi:hypothetical protein